MSRCSVVTIGRLAADHIAALERLHTSVTVDRRCADLAELIAVAELQRADAALIIGDTAPLTASMLSGLRQCGIRVVVISDVAQERSRLSRLGARCFSDEVQAQTLAAALQGNDGATGPDAEVSASDAEPSVDEPPSLAAARGDHLARKYSGAFPEKSDPAQSDPLSAQEDPDHLDLSGNLKEKDPAEAEVAAHTAAQTSQDMNPGADTDSAASGRRAPAAGLPGITVVWGPAGAPGRTTVAVNLAAELAMSNASVLLIDADAHASSVAVQLGLLEESAGLAQACRAAELGGLDADRLSQAKTTAQLRAAGHSAVLPVLTGLPRAERWAELRPRALERVLSLARSQYQHVVVDVGAGIEEDEELSFDTSAPQRNSATLTVLREADQVLALGTADAVGFSRLIKACEEYRHRLPQAPQPQVIINQLRTSAVGRSPRRQLTEAWEQLTEQNQLRHFLPYDRQACDDALRTGQVLAEVAPESALRRQLTELAGIQLPRRRRLQMSRRRVAAR